MKDWLQPKLLGMHALAVLALIITVFMGYWQLGVYDQRQNAARAEQQAGPAVPLSEVLGTDEAFEGKANNRKVVVTGTWSNDQFWVADRNQDGQVGYWLTAPLLTQNGSALLVARGWSAEAENMVPLPAGEQTFEVVLTQSEASSRPLNAERIIPTLRIATLVNEFDFDLYSGFGMNTDPGQSGGLKLIKPPEPETSWTVGSRNLVYALQWWVFGAFAVFMWWRMSNDILKAQREEPN